MKKVLNDALDLVKPSAQEVKEVNNHISIILKQINKGLKGCKAVLGGSGAKDTWLKGSHDADIFVQFDYEKFKGKEISEILGKHLMKNFKKVSRLHGSRDYFQIKDKKNTFEIIPVLKISRSEQAFNITDASLLHAKWVVKHKQYVDDIRLLKQFCKAQKVYGAESYIKGFSGYMCEILTIYYKGFMKVIRAGAKWKPQTVLDASKFYTTQQNVLFHLNKSKITGPLVMVDPIQKDRNAAAALSQEQYGAFIAACRKFLKKESLSYFTYTEFDLEKLKKVNKKKQLVVIDFKAFSGKKDVVGCKIMKAFEYISDNLEKKGFVILDSGWEWEKNLMWFVFSPKKLSATLVKQGPPKKMEYHVKKFKKQYKQTSISKGHVVAKVKRKYVSVVPFLKNFLKDKYFKDNLKKISVC